MGRGLLKLRVPGTKQEVNRPRDVLEPVNSKIDYDPKTYPG
jgi:hypothetical protein